MQNKICIPEAPQCTPPTFDNLAAGQMFRFADSFSPANVYMKTSTDAMVLLKNGSLYSNRDTRKGRYIVVVPKVTIEAQ